MRMVGVQGAPPCADTVLATKYDVRALHTPCGPAGRSAGARARLDPLHRRCRVLLSEGGYERETYERGIESGPSAIFRIDRYKIIAGPLAGTAMKNHFVPKFYFRPWLDLTGHLRQFSRTPSGQIVSNKKTPGQICYRPDLHTLTGPIDAAKQHVVEEWLNKSIDDKAAPVVSKIVAHGLTAINDEEAHAVAGLILSLIVRRPENVAYLQSQAPGEWKAAMERVEQNMRLELEGTPDADSMPTLREYAEMHHPGAVENSGNLLITGITADPKYWRRLMNLCWWVADFSGTSVDNQPTTDRAVAFTGTGLDDPNVTVILPLSPHKVLYLNNLNERDKCQARGLGWLGLTTMRVTIANARRFVYGTSGTNANIIGKWLA